MKGIFLSTLIILLINYNSYSQIDRFNKNYTAGHYISKDHSITKGLLQIYLTQLSPLKFKKNETAEVQKIKASEILGFKIDSTEFQTIENIKVIGALSMKRPIKSCFAQVLEKGKINLFLIYFMDYNAISQSTELFQNLILVKDNSKKIAVPLYHRIKSKKIEKIKSSLKEFLNNQTKWNDKIDIMRREGGMAETIDLVREYNKN